MFAEYRLIRCVIHRDDDTVIQHLDLDFDEVTRGQVRPLSSQTVGATDPFFVGEVLQLASNKFAASISVANANHIRASHSKFSLSLCVRKACAIAKHRLAFSRHSWGLPGMGITRVCLRGHRDCRGRQPAFQALKSDDGHLRNDGVLLDADHPGYCSTLLTEWTFEPLRKYFKCNHNQ